MKKSILIILLCFGLLLPSALSWGASRSISGNDVTITIDTAGTTGCVIRETIPDSLTVTRSTPSGTYNAAKDFLKWIFADACPTQVSYVTTGSGTVSGQMSSAGTSQDIIGDTRITACVPNCGSKVCGDDGCGGSCGTCLGGATCTAGACLSVGGGPGIVSPTCSDGIKNQDETQIDCGGPCSACGGGGGGGGGTVNHAKQAFLGNMSQFYDEAEPTGTGWTLSLLSRIANYLRSVFS